MKQYHIAVERDDGWYVGRVLERSGVTTQGRTLDELVDMLRDAIELMWREKDVQLELIIGSQKPSHARSRTGLKKRRRKRATVA